MGRSLPWQGIPAVFWDLFFGLRSFFQVLLRSIPGAAWDKPEHQHQCWSWNLEFCGCISLFAQGEHLEISLLFFGDIFGKLRAPGSG